MTSFALILGAGAAVAYANGANDVSKGIATLVASGVTDHRRAILWGSLCTGLGALTGGAFAGAMISTFGTGLLTPHVIPTFVAAVATLLGAAAWVLLATRTGLPVSTTHAIVGALIGVATLAYGPDSVQWNTVAWKILLPLLLSPIVALGIVFVAMRLGPWSTGDAADGTAAPADCLCVSVLGQPMVAGNGPDILITQFTPAKLAIDSGSQADCEAVLPRAARLTVDSLHWLSSGATSFARGMNDAPKIVALMLAAMTLGVPGGVSPVLLFGLAAAAMVGGSLRGGRRVTEVLADKVTTLDHREGLLANLVTAALVGAGAIGGFPMSTTHVSSSAIIATGMQAHRPVQHGTVRQFLLAWLLTVPGAALLADTFYWLATHASGMIA